MTCMVATPVTLGHCSFKLGFSNIVSDSYLLGEDMGNGAFFGAAAETQAYGSADLAQGEQLVHLVKLKQLTVLV